MMASDLTVGAQFVYRDVRVTVLRDREPGGDLFDRPGFFRFWCKREDTGEEGYMCFGPGGVVKATRRTDPGD